MSEHGTLVGKDTLRFERLLPGPIERVWAFLTEGEHRAKWLAGGSTELKVGGAVRLEFNHNNLTPHDDPPPERFADQQEGVVHTGKVLRCEPPRLLEHTWDEGDGHISAVTFELTQQGEQVLLVLTHRRAGSRRALVQTSGGWHVHLDILATVLSGGVPSPFWPRYEKREAEYETRVPE